MTSGKEEDQHCCKGLGLLLLAQRRPTIQLHWLSSGRQVPFVCWNVVRHFGRNNRLFRARFVPKGRSVRPRPLWTLFDRFPSVLGPVRKLCVPRCCSAGGRSSGGTHVRISDPLATKMRTPAHGALILCCVFAPGPPSQEVSSRLAMDRLSKVQLAVMTMCSSSALSHTPECLWWVEGGEQSRPAC